MIRTFLSSAAILLLFQSPVLADELDDLRANLAKLFPAHMTVDAISESPMAGVYDVTAGNQNLYVMARDEFVMIGDIYDVNRKVSLGEEKKYEKMVAALADVPESEMIIMGDVESDRYITVFTDTDCGYCQKFHQEIGDLAEGGLKVRYMMFPRAGVGSDSYNEAVSVWCADDQGEAMTVAKNRGRVEPKTCENPVASQYELGQQIGIRGTPTMILDSGEVIPGYVPSKNLLAQAGLAPTE